MDRIIEGQVCGSYLTLDSSQAGVQGEANVTALRLEFDESWDGFAKTIVWYNAKGEDPTTRILTADLLEDIAASARVYMTWIPPEALTCAGKCRFAIDGYIGGRRQRSVYGELVVKPDPNAEDTSLEDVTPTQAEQLQTQIDVLLEDMQGAIAAGEEAAASAQAAADSADAAAGSAGEAGGFASAAETSAGGAEASAREADANAAEARSWAVGGTDTRPGEDTDNARYYCQQAQAAAGGGVTSFNGRSGSVTPQAGDYGPQQGVATLDGDGKVMAEQLPAMDYVPTAAKGQANGVATLGEDGKVPETQLPVMFRPQILVTTTPENTVTCAKGETVLTAAADENGQCVFNLPDYGQWTVTESFAGLTAAVTVDTVRQYAVDVDPQLMNYTMLYDYGDQCQEATGGWQEKTNIYNNQYGQPVGIAWAQTNNPIDLAEYVMVAGVGAGLGSQGDYGMNNSIGESSLLLKYLTSEGTAPFLKTAALSDAARNTPNVIKAAETALVTGNTVSPSVTLNADHIYSNVSSSGIYVRGRMDMLAVFKEDDWQTLAEKAGIAAATMAELLTQSAALLENDDAVSFMLLRCTGDFMAAAIQSSAFLAALEAAPCRADVLANEHWAKFLGMVGVSA